MNRYGKNDGLARRVQVMLFTIAVGVLAGGPQAWAKREKVQVPEGAIGIDSLLIVDCLLPPQIRQMGQGFTYLAARRPIRTSAKDCAIRGGEYVAYDRANYGTALKTWLPAAREGDANAMNYVGEIYEKGLGTEPDYAAAVQWYRKAADKGNSTAMINLGSLYERGEGVERDMVQAMNWYRKASGLTDSTLEVTTEAEQAQRRADAEELERLREETATLKGDLAAAREQLRARQAAVAEAESELARVRQQAQRLAAASQEARAAQARIAELEGALETQKVDLAMARASTDSKLAQLGVDLGKRGPAPKGTPPQISVISPKLSLTRAGVLAAPLLAAVPTYQVIGRVYPSEGLRTVRVNDRDVLAVIDEDGIFEASIPVLAADTAVEIQVVTQDGMSTVENFVLTMAEQNAGQADKRAVSGMFKRRMRSDLGNFHALVIGNASYSNFAALKTPVQDAEAIAAVLRERYGYQVQTLVNASRAQIIQALSEYTGKLKNTDNLLIYFAGHGQLDAAGDGHWIPVEGQRAAPDTWVSNKIVTDFIGAMQAKHVMVVADSCYSGAIGGSAIRPLPANAKEEDLLFISRVKARTVITSGGLEPVLDAEGGDHSIFAAAFLRALRSNDTLSEGSRIFSDVRQQVGFRASTLRLQQRPSYSALKFAGHEGSEFFFLPKDV